MRIVLYKQQILVNIELKHDNMHINRKENCGIVLYDF